MLLAVDISFHACNKTSLLSAVLEVVSDFSNVDIEGEGRRVQGIVKCITIEASFDE